MAGKIIKVFIGLILLGLGAWTCYLWWADLLTIIRGSIGLFLILAALVTFALVSD